jgi:hypothetical protein
MSLMAIVIYVFIILVYLTLKFVNVWSMKGRVWMLNIFIIFLYVKLFEREYDGDLYLFTSVEVLIRLEDSIFIFRFYIH